MNSNNNLLVLIPFIILLLFGLTFVTSSSVYVAQDMTGNPFFFAQRHILFLILGALTFFILLSVPSDIFMKFDYLFLFISLFLLLILFIPNVGATINGSTRWIDLGIFKLQPSELSKVVLIIYISGYCVRRLSQISTLLGFFRPMMVLAIFSILIMLQPDLGSTLIICAVSVTILFFAGISIGQFIILSGLMTSLGALSIYLTPFRLTRLRSFLNPFEDPTDSGWQLTNALMGIGRGEFFGVGLGNSIQKNLYLPEPHTDFIFAVILEEIGILGGIGLILVFSFLVYGIMRVGLEAFKNDRLFQSFICFGGGSLIAIQSIFNIGVNIGLLPTKGLTLPFISYGGASLITFMGLAGIIIRINFENKLTR
tara:strand:+ start:34533 stop:35636 length:1104 start_codon:yes stop_codon:yes gene_type:complete